MYLVPSNALFWLTFNIIEPKCNKFKHNLKMKTVQKN